MRSPVHRRFAPAALVAGAALLTTGAIAFEPAAAQGVGALAALVTCNSSSPCASWQNNGSGNAIQATAAQGDGVRAYAQAKGKAGVYGEADSSSGGYGVHGNNSAANGVAVYATGGAGTGVSASTTGEFGMYSSATNGYATYSQATAGVGLAGISLSGYGLIAESNTGIALYGETASTGGEALDATNFAASSAGMYQGDGAHVLASNGNGAVISNGSYTQNGIDAVTSNDSVRFGEIVGGKSFGLIAVTGAGTGGYPLEASSANSSGTVTGFFYVDGGGSVHYTGTLQSYAHTRNGANVTAYETKSTQASVEDSGTAQLVAGSAVVHLDPAFAQSIDLSSAYRIFLTPNGDTRGLYVAQKTPTAFIVRETQGGHGTFAFDYRILATAAGHAAERMTAVTPAVQAQAFPMLRARSAPSTSTGIPAQPNLAHPPTP